MEHRLDKFVAEAAASKGPAPYAKSVAHPACDDMAHQFAKRRQLVTEIAHQREYGNIAGACWFEGQLEICERAIKRIETSRAADMPKMAAAE